MSGQDHTFMKSKQPHVQNVSITLHVVPSHVCLFCYVQVTAGTFSSAVVNPEFCLRQSRIDVPTDPQHLFSLMCCYTLLRTRY